MTVVEIALLVIVLLTVGTVIRVFIGPTVWDRLIGIGLVGSKVTIAVVLMSLYFEESYILDIALILAVIGFLAKVLIARYIERGGDI